MQWIWYVKEMRNESIFSESYSPSVLAARH